MMGKETAVEKKDDINLHFLKIDQEAFFSRHFMKNFVHNRMHKFQQRKMIYKTFCEKIWVRMRWQLCPLSHTPAISAEKYWLQLKSIVHQGLQEKKILRSQMKSNSMKNWLWQSISTGLQIKILVFCKCGGWRNKLTKAP